MTQTKTLLEVDSLTKRYGQHTALDKLSLTIPEGVVFGLLGPNGAGKSTFIRLLNRIIFPDIGSIKLYGEELNAAHVMALGYLPEERGLFKKMKVGEQLVYLAMLRGMGKEEATRKAKQKLEIFEALPWWDKKLESLSKGMQQKVQFIATILHDPKLVILDEPFSGFDPMNADTIKAEILQLKAKGCSVILSTHRMESVETLCDQIALIHKSTLRLHGDTMEVKNRFKKYQYAIAFEGKLPATTPFKVVSETAGHAVIQGDAHTNNNTLLKELMLHVEIHAFSEILPDMNQVFIQTIQDNKAI